MRYTFEWDPIKAKENLRKHGINFDRAAEVLTDRLAISIVDEEHSEEEERWVTVGKDRRGTILVLIHTFLEVSVDECKLRIISARRATSKENRQYEDTER